MLPTVVKLATVTAVLHSNTSVTSLGEKLLFLMGPAELLQYDTHGLTLVLHKLNSYVQSIMPSLSRPGSCAHPSSQDASQPHGTQEVESKEGVIPRGKGNGPMAPLSTRHSRRHHCLHT